MIKTQKFLLVFGGFCVFAMLAALSPETALADDNKNYSSPSLMEKVFSVGDELMKDFLGENYGKKNEKNLADRQYIERGRDGRRRGEERRREIELRQREEERRREEDRRREERRRRDRKSNDCDTGAGAFGMAAPLLVLLKKRRP